VNFGIGYYLIISFLNAKILLIIENILKFAKA